MCPFSFSKLYTVIVKNLLTSFKVLLRDNSHRHNIMICFLQEYFLLLMREILDPKYGMFKIIEENHLIWFNKQVKNNTETDYNNPSMMV